MIPLPPSPPSTATMPDWFRKAAALINQLLVRQPFPPSATAPLNPRVGDGYIDTADSNRIKVWDGSAYQPLW